LCGAFIGCVRTPAFMTPKGRKIGTENCVEEGNKCSLTAACPGIFLDRLWVSMKSLNKGSL
jgi:hypothetical protein